MPQLGARVAHPYLERKGVGAHGIYLNTAGPLTLFAGEDRPQLWSAKDELIVTICDLDGALLGAQSIAADGRKSITRGAAIVGGHHLIGELAADGQLMIAEGYATAATLHEATGLPVAVAFHSGNLEPVAAAYRDRFPDLHIYIAGDNDHRAERELGADGRPRQNVGRVKAETAAAAVGGVAMLPSFGPDNDGSDWNDLANALGGQFKAVLREALAVADRQLTVITSKEALGVSAEQAQPDAIGNDALNAEDEGGSTAGSGCQCCLDADIICQRAAPYLPHGLQRAGGMPCGCAEDLSDRFKTTARLKSSWVPATCG